MNNRKIKKSVTLADFSFTLDASALAVGNHALKVKLIMSGVEYTASINVTTSWYPSQGYGVNTGCYPGSGMSWAWYVPRKYGYKIYITFTPLNPACQIKAQVYATSPWGCGAGACNPFPIVNAVGAGPGAPVTMEYDLGKAFSCCPWGWYNDYFNAYIKYESMNSACYSGPFVKAEMAAPPAMGSLFAGSPYPCGGW